MIQKRLLFLRKLLKSFKEFVVYVLSDGGVVEAKEYVNSQMKKAQNASILQIPSAFKTDVLYNQIPINPSEDFDVVRNSDVWRTNESGILENIGINVPCIDYSDGFPVLLTQPQSTNFVRNSSTLSLQLINNSGIVTDNAVISPEGIQNAAIYETDGLTSSYIRSYLTFTSTSAAQLATFSFHVKYINNQWVRFRTLLFNVEAEVWFDIINGVIGNISLPLNTTAKIEPLKDGWYRISMTREFDFSTDRLGLVNLYIVNDDDRGDQTAGKQVALYVPQAEELGYATTPIKTGVSVVTRLQDEITGAGSTNTINSEEGVLYVERATIDFVTGNYISLNDGSTDNRVYISVNTNQIRCGADINNISQGTQGDLANIYDFNKIALVYDSDSLRLYLNENPTPIATLALTDTLLPNTLTELDLGTGGNNVNTWDKTKELRVYKSIAEAKIDLPYIT